MLGEFTRKDQPDRGLDLARGDGGLLRVGSEFYKQEKKKGRNASENRYLIDIKALDVLEASVAMRSNISLTKLLRMAIALLEIPVSGWTCLRTEKKMMSQRMIRYANQDRMLNNLPL